MAALSWSWAGLVEIMWRHIIRSGDNAVVIGLAAAGLPKEQRNKAILIGIMAATVLRIGFALITTTLLGITGLLLAGGVLLLWVCWKMYRELRSGHQDLDNDAHETLEGADLNRDGTVAGRAPRKTLRHAAMQIVIADVSMSLDNVLAVAGAAHEHPAVLIFGLALSIALMGLAATFLARLLGRYRWIAWVGLVLILYVALKMIHDGYLDVRGIGPHSQPEPPAATAPATP